MWLRVIIFFLYLLDHSSNCESFENRYKNPTDSGEECDADYTKIPRLFQKIHAPWNYLVNSTLPPRNPNLIGLYYAAKLTIRNIRIELDQGCDALISLAQREGGSELESDMWKAKERIKELFEETVKEVEFYMEFAESIADNTKELSVPIPSDIIEDLVWLKFGVKYKQVLDKFKDRLADLTLAVASVAEKIAHLPEEYFNFSDIALSVIPEIIGTVAELSEHVLKMLSPLSPGSTRERMPRTVISYEREHGLAAETYNNAAEILLELSLDFLTELEGYKGDYRECDLKIYDKMIKYLGEETEKVEALQITIRNTTEVSLNNIVSALYAATQNYLPEKVADQLGQVVTKVQGEFQVTFQPTPWTDESKEALKTKEKLAKSNRAEFMLEILDQYWDLHVLNVDGLGLAIKEIQEIIWSARKTIRKQAENEFHDIVQYVFAESVERFSKNLNIVVVEASVELHSMMVRITENLFETLKEHAKYAVQSLKKEFVDYSADAEFVQGLTRMCEEFLLEFSFQVPGKRYEGGWGAGGCESRKLPDEHVWELRARYLKVTNVVKQFEENVSVFVTEMMIEGAVKDKFLAKPAVICHPSASSSYLLIFQKLFILVGQLNQMQRDQSGIMALEEILYNPVEKI